MRNGKGNEEVDERADVEGGGGEVEVEVEALADRKVVSSCSPFSLVCGSNRGLSEILGSSKILKRNLSVPCVI